MKVNKDGFRKDLKPFFTQHTLTIPMMDKQATPFLVVNEDTIEKCNTVDALLEYPNKTEVLQAWPGKARSDVFYFTVKDVKEYIKTGGN